MADVATVDGMADVATVDGPAGRIAFRRYGAGHPLVLLHPLALSGAVWGPFGEAMAAHYDVIAPDARGHGGSEWDGRPFDAADLAADVAALLDGLGVASAHLLGMSTGGSVAVTFAGTHPHRLNRSVLADTTAWYGPEAIEAWTERSRRAASVPRVRQVPFQVDRWFTERFRRICPGEVNRVVGVFLATDSAAHAQASLALGRLDARGLLDRITAPTAAVAGDEDYATPPEMGRFIAEHVRDGQALTLPGLRHLSLVERTDLAGLVHAFLGGQPLPAMDHPAGCGCRTEAPA